MTSNSNLCYPSQPNHFQVRNTNKIAHLIFKPTEDYKNMKREENRYAILIVSLFPTV